MREDRIPVIVGVGEIADRHGDDVDGLETAALMREALKRADADAGGGWLARIEWLDIVCQLAWPYTDIAQTLSGMLAISPAHAKEGEIGGESPVRFINQAANRIAAGEITTAAIVGGEATHSAGRAKKAGRALASWTPPSDNPPRRIRAKDFVSPSAIKYGIAMATDVYPLYESGCRAAWKQTLGEAQDESAAIWSLMSKVAAENPNAWLRTAKTPEEIKTVSPDNRLIAHPYPKLMVANNNVNLGGALIITSLAAAKAAGVPEEKLVYVWAGAAANEPRDFFARDRYDYSPSMEVVLESTLAMNGVKKSELDHVELYSCFPCVPKMARRIVDWPLDKPASVIGGLTFAGAPINSLMTHAACGMTRKLREGGMYGLLFGNGEFVTKNHAILLARKPPPDGLLPKSFDMQAEADKRRGPSPPFRDAYEGPGTIETFTIVYDREGAPSYGVVIARAPTGERFVARAPKEDEATIAALRSATSEPIGKQGKATIGTGGLTEWTM